VDDRYVGTLELAFFCTDSRERIVGEVWHRLDLKLKEDTYRRGLAEGLRYGADVPIDGIGRYVKVIVYDHRSDRVGSAIARVY